MQNKKHTKTEKSIMQNKKENTEAELLTEIFGDHFKLISKESNHLNDQESNDSSLDNDWENIDLSENSNSADSFIKVTIERDSTNAQKNLSQQKNTKKQKNKKKPPKPLIHKASKPKDKNQLAARPKTTAKSKQALPPETAPESKQAETMQLETALKSKQEAVQPKITAESKQEKVVQPATTAKPKQKIVPEVAPDFKQEIAPEVASDFKQELIMPEIAPVKAPDSELVKQIKLYINFEKIQTEFQNDCLKKDQLNTQEEMTEERAASLLKDKNYSKRIFKNSKHKSYLKFSDYMEVTSTLNIIANSYPGSLSKRNQIKIKNKFSKLYKKENQTMADYLENNSLKDTKKAKEFLESFSSILPRKVAKKIKNNPHTISKPQTATYIKSSSLKNKQDIKMETIEETREKNSASKLPYQRQNPSYTQKI